MCVLARSRSRTAAANQYQRNIHENIVPYRNGQQPAAPLSGAATRSCGCFLSTLPCYHFIIPPHVLTKAGDRERLREGTNQVTKGVYFLSTRLYRLQYSNPINPVFRFCVYKNQVFSFGTVRRRTGGPRRD